MTAVPPLLDSGGVSRRLVPALCALVLAGCGSPADPSAAWQGRIDTVGAGVVVRNPPEPLLADDAVRVRERWLRPLGWSADQRHLWEPGPVVRARDGRVLVLDPVRGVVEVRAAADGRHLHTIEPDSAGDGEPFAGTHALAVTGRSVVVADTHRIALLGPEGGPHRRLSLEERVIDVYGAGDGAFLVYAFGGSGARWRLYTEADSAGAPYRPPITRSETHPDAARSECWKVEGLSDGLMLVSCAHPVVLRFDRASQIVREVAFPCPVVEPSEEQVEAVRAAARTRATERRPGLAPRTVERLVEREVRRHPLVKKHRAVRHDPSSDRFAVLVQTPDYMGGGTASLLLFAGDGKHLATLEFRRQWLDFDLRDGVVYAVARDPGSMDTVLVAHELQLEGEAGA